jgi:glycyl-tRNA synthetase (class II)
VDCKKCKSRYRADKLIEDILVVDGNRLKKIGELTKINSNNAEARTFEEQKEFLEK